jgi:hypothetical protein
MARRKSPNNKSCRPFLEMLEDRTLLDSTGPHVLSVTPQEIRNAVFDHLDVRFDEAVDAATFTPADVGILGPNGIVAANQISVVAPDTLRVQFNRVQLLLIYAAVANVSG